MNNKITTFEQFKMLGNRAKTFINDRISNLAGLTSTAISELQTGKQDKLTGKEGQIVGFNSVGNVVNFNGPINENLVDNPNFKINQREQTSYTEGGYTIDRWISSPELVVSLEDGHIKLSNSTDNDLFFVQPLELDIFKNLNGNVITLSFLYFNNKTITPVSIRYGDSNDNYFNLAHTSMAVTNEKFSLASVTSDNVIYATSATIFQILIQIPPHSDLYLKACKLECSNHQTLAHQDLYGNWILNEIPDYATELLKCQRYFVSGKGTWATGSYVDGAGLMVTVPASMRANPTAIFSRGVSQVYAGGSWIDLSFRETQYFQSMILLIYNISADDIPLENAGKSYLMSRLPDLSSDL